MKLLIVPGMRLLLQVLQPAPARAQETVALPAAGVGLHDPMVVAGVWCRWESVCPAVLMGPCLQEEERFVFPASSLSFENAAGGPFSSGKLV